MSISSGSKILASDVNSHINNTNNPHGITPAQIGAATTAEVQELKTSVSEGKALVAAAVTDKGVSTAADATFATIAENISNIPSGSSYVGTLAHSQTFEYMMGWYGIKSIYLNYLK